MEWGFMKVSLPVDAQLDRILAALEGHSSLVLTAAPGAGKTTRVPPALLRADFFAAEHPECWVLEPRRVAARGAAARIADEQGWRLGDEIGYQIRFEKRVGPKTRLRIVTEGILTRRLQADPLLEGIGCVVLDEFHERSLHTDLGLALLRELQRGARPDLKILVMSATLDAEPVARFLGDCPVIHCEGRVFPVEVRHAPRPGVWSDLRDLDRDLEGALESLVRESADDRGHILVFLPGAPEIRRCERGLAGWAARRNVDLFALHGSLSSDEQDAALRSSRERRKVILATNIAETSLTIDGVTAVVDTGLAKVMRAEPRLGTERLELSRISKASAAQRTGRAGRQAPGRSVRLWSKAEESAFREFEAPEIRRVDLAPVCLMLADWGLRNAREFGWFEAPAEPQIEAAEKLLSWLGGRTAAGEITARGRAWLRDPLHPRLACILEAARASGDANLLRRAAGAVALLAERDIVSRRDARERGAGAASVESDLDSRLEVLEGGRGEDSVDSVALRQVVRARDAYLDLRGGGAKPVAGIPRVTTLAQALLAGYPDRVARRRGKGDARGLMVGGRGVVLDASSLVRESELFLCLDAEDQKVDGRLETLVRRAVALARDDLAKVFPDAVTEREETRLDETRGTLSGWRIPRYRDLPIAEPIAAPLSASAKEDLVRLQARARARELFEGGEGSKNYLLRARWLARVRPELALPAWTDEELAELAETGASSASNLAELRALDWRVYLEGSLTEPQRRAVRDEAPASVVFPNGRHGTIDYGGENPVLSGRLQDFFGWKETPCLAGGRVPLVLEMLSPAQRPVQITRDLAGFWKGSYAEVRKDLRARYPKHAWPEDPSVAEPIVRKGRR